MNYDRQISISKDRDPDVDADRVETWKEDSYNAKNNKQNRNRVPTYFKVAHVYLFTRILSFAACTWFVFRDDNDDKDEFPATGKKTE